MSLIWALTIPNIFKLPYFIEPRLNRSVAVLPHFGTDLLAQTPQPSVKENLNLPLDVADSIYSSNTTKFLG
jgi:hypothetical protein